jgi:hypothetical protein
VYAKRSRIGTGFDESKVRSLLEKQFSSEEITDIIAFIRRHERLHKENPELSETEVLRIQVRDDYRAPRLVFMIHTIKIKINQIKIKYLKIKIRELVITAKRIIIKVKKFRFKKPNTIIRKLLAKNKKVGDIKGNKLELKDDQRTTQNKADSVSSAIDGMLNGMAPIGGGVTARIGMNVVGNSLMQTVVSNSI